jgi:NAD(P)-dependent dehydrogenase (short-subunit alcohol dehydrogenase family)
MRVLVTGASSGIGLEAVRKFLIEGHDVYGIDRAPMDTSIQSCCTKYKHFLWDIRESLPAIGDGPDILINNAGVQTDTKEDIDVNLVSLIRATKAYGLHPDIKSIVNIGSASAHNGAEFGYYVASKGGVLAYTKWTAREIARYGATCNSISPGGVTTASNKHILEDPEKWKAVKDETLLDKWASPKEIAEWIYFVAVINKSMTGQDIVIDNGELIKSNFIW